ncbi:DUF4214 domain-containing protein [Shimia sediminis]|uniref:DUF4214 domain-containing protein n=1 Tax=Shimia sediminis TaxID=2497945 RepID=UPI000F8DB5EC|nr:DUF4214 domain-containing protein [Shimia sediminis]
MTSTNPLYASQWHLPQIGDIETVWQDYTGQGVSVGVYDDGVERTHEDLVGNYDASLHFSGDNGQPNSSSDGHGTAVAGIIGASDNNLGGVGIAFDSSITGVDYLNDLQNVWSTNLATLRWSAEFDIVNNSWGSLGVYGNNHDIGDFSSAAAQQANAFEYGAINGRGGLGTIIVKAAGNEANDSSLINNYGVYGNAQGAGLNSAHHVITVGAIEQGGAVSSYSNYGHNLLISAPAASVTTDRTGSAGYSSGEYTTGFNGTSAATPVVSGVIALILEANPDLGWRDVQNILAMSAAQTGSNYGSSSSGYEVAAWTSNSAGNWNGGGVSFNPSYGYGHIDVLAAVRLAEIWGLMYDTAATSANVQTVTASSSQSAMQITDYGTVTMSVTVSGSIEIEHLYVNVDLTHTYSGDLAITLISPDGERHQLFYREGWGTDITGDYTFGMTNFRGVDSAGTWSIEVRDFAGGDTGWLRDLDLEFRGSAQSADTEWFFTNDFQALASVESGRQSISDTDGGTDTLVFAAVTGNVSINLASGGSIQVDGTQWATLANDAIENVILGDGNDTVTGNDADNNVSGGRGQDRLIGGQGDDTLMGDQGSDLLVGSTGNDSLSGGEGADHLEGANGQDTLQGDEGDDFLNGEQGIGSFDFQANQVYRLYRATLDREPDYAGHRSWTEALIGGQTLENIVSGFVNSVEFQSTYGATSNTEFVTLLYNNVLDRNPSASEMAPWVAALDNNTQTREQVVLGFSESAEFQNNTSGSALSYSWSGYQSYWTDNMFRLYQAVLDRAPDIAGLWNWTAALANGETLEWAASGLMASTEFQNIYGSTTNTQFVTLLYNNVLDRAPDAAGLASWLNALESGSMTREEIVLGFSESLEFIANSWDDFIDFQRTDGADDRIDGGAGTNTLFGGWGSDTFVFDSTEAGSHSVIGLEAWDMIELQQFGFANGAAALAALSQVGDDVTLTQGGTTITFEGVQISDFSEDMFVLV